ncbi:hypothetical protein [Sphingomonas sp. LR55]|uniref:hypothetical protein n=1 Tax=Sphingomonas sp. LR55 TaxID=3050231 RepID=UPI002FE2C8FF
MTFARIDLQLTEEQAVVVAETLGPVLPGFTKRFKEMMDAGPEGLDHHMAIVYRSREVQNAMDADEPGAPK